MSWFSKKGKDSVDPSPTQSSTSSIKSNKSSSKPRPSPRCLTEPTLLVTPTRPASASEGEEQTKYDEIFKHFSDLAAKGIPTTGKKDAAEVKPFSQEELMWLSEDCFLRYLRAQKWDVPSAITKLTSTMLWRREQGLADDVNDSFGSRVKEEGASGKDYWNGWDETGRPLHYQVPAKNESNNPDLNIAYCVWIMEVCIHLSPPGVEKQVLLVNFAGGLKPPPLHTVQGWISALGNHYPERMGKCIALNVPWILNAFFKVILPWIDPVTRAKLVFNERAPFVPDDQLQVDFGGKLEFGYRKDEYDEYFKSVQDLVAQKRKEYRDRWVAGGSQIGASEWVLKGGDETISKLLVSTQNRTGSVAKGQATTATETTAVDGLPATSLPATESKNEEQSLGDKLQEMNLEDAKESVADGVPGSG